MLREFSFYNRPISFSHRRRMLINYKHFKGTTNRLVLRNVDYVLSLEHLKNMDSCRIRIAPLPSCVVSTSTILSKNEVN